MLCIYPISKDSEPRQANRPDGRRRRVNLEAEEHVVGIALFFPKARGPQGGFRYIAVPVADPEVEEPEEGDDIDALDAADEAAGAAQDAADPVT